MSQSQTRSFGIMRALVVLLVAVLLVTTVSCIKHVDGEINYRCSDATWHTLLTIHAYEQTPVETHKFLPIVTLGDTDDKGIPWGATIADEEGNYYYTSFSAAGFVLPYLFIKVFGLPATEESLYLFNSLLFFASAALWGLLILQMYKKSKYVLFVALIGMAVYVFAPELLHGMGICYWHQSLMQVTFLIQVLAYMHMKEQNSKVSCVVFYLFSLLNPYIEWTGYIANVGFALAEMILHWKESKVKAFLKAVLLGIITIGSFAAFALHYLSVVELSDFLLGLSARFMKRNVTSGISVLDVFKGYVLSFWWLWALAAVLFVWCIIKTKGVKIKNKLLFFILLFSILENFVMTQHAYQYSYDRMKLIFALSLGICELSFRIMEHANKKQLAGVIITCLVVLISALNLTHYVNNPSYIWTIDYRANNEAMAKYIEGNYTNYILGSNASVRGYDNLLFGKGIYERTTGDALIDTAERKSKDFAIMLKAINDGRNFDEFEEAVVYDLKTGNASMLRIENGAVCEYAYPLQGVGK